MILSVIRTIGATAMILSGLAITTAVLVDGAQPDTTAPLVYDDTYVYREDPCVEAMRAAMERIEPWIPQSYRKGSESLWSQTSTLTDEQIEDLYLTLQQWQETKLQCFRR